MSERPSWILPIKRLVHSRNVFEWCKYQYPGHKKGCPNYCKVQKCPPFSKYVTEIFDITQPLYFVFSEFDLLAHVEKMRNRHPKWTERQLRNCLYWQPRSRKQMLERTKQAILLLKTEMMHLMPEAIGVNVYATAAISGMRLEKIKDIETCHHISMLGYPVIAL